MFRRVRWLIFVCAFLALPAMGYAQEAVLTGTITDSTGGVLPGVTVVAVHEATGNRFEGVTDGSGIYRIPARVGSYRVTAELQGFTTVARPGVQVLVGQTANVNMQMSPSTLQETVTVTAEAPLLDVTTSNIGGNVDPSQVQELPVAGRNWMALALLAPGSRTSTTDQSAPLPDRNGGEAREFQLNLDGQQISSELGTGGQPRFSQDSIAEFQYISNRFDATQGRSSGVQVNAITKSGTNMFAGLFRSNFRDSRFNAEDPVLERVLPISNQQYSTAVGGPIVIDRLHYFTNFEYEREPQASAWNTPFPHFNIQLEGKANRKIAGFRADYQLSPQMRIMGKVSGQNGFDPFGNGTSNSHPAQNAFTTEERNREYAGQFTTVISNRAVNELKGGWSHFGFENRFLSQWSRHFQAPRVTNGHPRITFTGFSVAGNANYPRHRDQKVWHLRDDFTFSYEARGRHDLRAGGEWLDHFEDSENCNRCGGQIDARRGTLQSLGIPVEQIFPEPFNTDSWNLALISPLVRSYTIGVGQFPLQYHQPKVGAWLQDDWRLTDNLTLNLGLRYDVSFNSFGNDVEVLPFYRGGRPNDTDNIQPRIGFAYQVSDSTVLRGGTGLYYADALTVDAFWQYYNAQLSRIEIPNDGRPNFAADPLNGRPLPSFEEANRAFCHAPEQAGAFNAWRASGYAGAAPCLFAAYQEIVAPDEFMQQARTFQTSLGLQRQFTGVMAVEADYVYSQGRNEKDTIDNINLAYDPATGVNFPYATSGPNRARLPFPQYGTISMIPHSSRSAYHALITTFTKRMSNNWQASASYTLSGFWNAETQPFSGLEMVPFDVADDLGNDWSFASEDQRHRLVFNGIWAVGKGFQISGLHYFGAGIRSATSYGGDLRNTGSDFSARLRPNGTIVPRNSFIQPAQNKTDIRLQQRVPLGGRVGVDLIAELFNAFNRPNWTIETEESAGDFGERVSGQYRTAQFGFRVTF
jgi:hypothetical protein